MKMPSAAYERSVQDQRAHHARSKTFSGSLLRPHLPEVLKLCRDLAVTSILDYGCGKAVCWTEDDVLERLMVTFGQRPELRLFDPCVPEYAAPVSRDDSFDLVILSHVLFWIPLEDLNAWVLPLIYDVAGAAVLIVETIGDEKKRILTDRDLHPRGLQAIDWLDLLLPHASKRQHVETHLITEYRASDGRIYPGRWEL